MKARNTAKSNEEISSLRVDVVVMPTSIEKTILWFQFLITPSK